jgi:hypothetical protein
MICKHAILGLVFVLAVPVSASAAGLSGTWTVSSTLWAQPHTCVFEQAGKFLSGSCKGPQADGTAFGTVNGQEIRWAWQGVSFADQKPDAWNFIGRLNPDSTIGGTLSYGNLVAPFTARRLKGS